MVYKIPGCQMSYAINHKEKCPACGAVGTLEDVEWETDNMSDGEASDYEAGLYGSVICSQCNTEIDFGF